MRTRKIGLRLAQCASASILLAGADSLTLGQESNTVPEVKIEAARSVTHEPSYPGGAKVEIVQVTHHVSYKDLDLSKTADAAKLEERIADAAKSGCKELDTLYPLTASPSTTGSCVKETKDRAMVQAKAALNSVAKSR